MKHLAMALLLAGCASSHELSVTTNPCHYGDNPSETCLCFEQHPEAYEGLRCCSGQGAVELMPDSEACP